MVGRSAAALCAVLLAMAACEPAEDDGVPPGGDGGRTPDARTTDGGGADAGTTDADPNDSDGDGVDNAADNCPAVANAGQEDEDGDVVGDVCDNCPANDNPGQVDGQETSNGNVADGVGDACDPRPTTGGDAIAFFDGFNGSALGLDWTAPLGTWTVSGGALHQTSAAVQPGLALWTTDPGDRARIETEVNLDQIAPAQGISDNSRTVGAVARLGALNGTGYSCLEFANPNDIPGTSQLLLYESTGASAGAPLATDAMAWNMAVDDPVHVRLQVRTTGTRQLCRLARIAGGVSQATGSDTTLTTGNVGVVTYGLAASFRYVIVYTLGM